jgi:hypothetical protein
MAICSVSTKRVYWGECVQTVDAADVPPLLRTGSSAEPSAGRRHLLAIELVYSSTAEQGGGIYAPWTGLPSSAHGAGDYDCRLMVFPPNLGARHRRESR